MNMLYYKILLFKLTTKVDIFPEFGITATVNVGVKLFSSK